jgi:hypothetical protein
VLSRLWPRFAFEAFFLIAVALVAGLLNFSVGEVIVAMAIAYVLTVGLELGAWYLRRRARPAADTPEDVAEPEPERAVAEPASAAVTVRPGDRPPRPEEDETWLGPAAPVETVQAEPEPEPEFQPEAEAEPEPVPTSEPQPAEPQPAVEDEEPEAEPEPEPEVEAEPEVQPAAAAPVLAAVAEPEPEPEPEPDAEAEPEPLGAPVATLPLPPQPREWNLWELERLTRDRVGEDEARDVEWGYLVVYLRDFARPDGTLPTEFDDLVRESFGELIATGAR